MKRMLFLLIACAAFFMMSANETEAQVSVQIGIGARPYYDGYYTPYYYAPGPRYVHIVPPPPPHVYHRPPHVYHRPPHHHPAPPPPRHHHPPHHHHRPPHHHR